MNATDTLTAFAAHFVKENLRERFLHEALKKPTKLQARICHGINELFPEQYKNGSAHFEPETPCLLLGRRSKFEETTWREASKQIGFGDGVLVISSTGRQFYAETEGSPLSEVWAGAR
jgi:hypothetical protein